MPTGGVALRLEAGRRQGPAGGGAADLRFIAERDGTILTVNPDGSQVVNVGGSTFNLRNRDFNTLSFRSNVVLRWEWRTGSTLYVVWQQDRSGTETLPTRVGIDDAFRSLTAPGTNTFLVKMSFWVPVK